MVFVTRLNQRFFSYTKGFGSKSGKIQVIEARGEFFSKLWISSKGFEWFRKGLKVEISKVWSKSQSWYFQLSDEWLSVTKGRNKGGEFLKLSGPNSWGSSVDLFFPTGKNGEGWNQILGDKLIKLVLLVKSINLLHKYLKWVQNPKSPFSNSKTMFLVSNTNMRNELLSIYHWMFQGIKFHYQPLSSKMNFCRGRRLTKLKLVGF
ncbi:hypothetical protein MKX01_012631 [Papaver californicum]|nr:hypothetical protein MKX01_012631 [Papaver californicum]